MAQQGYWPDPPSRRMAYDADGTIVLTVPQTLAFITELSTGQKQAINDEGSSYYQTYESGFGTQNRQYLMFMFPEKRNLTHYYCTMAKTYHYSSITSTGVEWSNDTSNGMDGNWTTVAASFQLNQGLGNGNFQPGTTPGFPDMRTLIETLPVDGVKAIRFGFYDSNGQPIRIHSFHLYGHKAAGETPHRLDFAFSDGAELVQDQDYGDQPRGSIRTWSTVDTWNIGSALFIRNRSADKVADSVTVTMQNLSSDMINRLTLSKDNISYGTQVTYTQIQPLQIVGPIYLKHNVPDSTTLGLYTARLKITVGTWI